MDNSGSVVSMKLFVFYPNPDLGCAWSLGEGLVRCLDRMGHKAIAVPIKTHYSVDAMRSVFPPYAELCEADGIIVSGMEHLASYIESVYGDAWKKLDVPVAAWYHESFDRKDVRPFEAVRGYASHHFFPALNDANTQGGVYLPFAADTTIFRPLPHITKNSRLGFIGVVYEKRQKFLDELRPALERIGVTLDVRQVVIHKGGEVSQLHSAQMYAQVVQRNELFLNLPTMSNLWVSKIVEVMACGVPIITPKVSEPQLFENAGYYDPYDLDGLVHQVEQSLKLGPSTLAMCGRDAYLEVLERHTIEARVEKILSVFPKR